MTLTFPLSRFVQEMPVPTELPSPTSPAVEVLKGLVWLIWPCTAPYVHLFYIWVAWIERILICDIYIYSVYSLSVVLTMTEAQLNHAEVNFTSPEAEAAPTATPTATFPTATLPTASDPTRTARTAEMPTATAPCGISGLVFWGTEDAEPQIWILR